MILVQHVRTGCMNELPSSIKVHTTIFHNHTLGMVWYILTNRYRGSVFKWAHPLIHSLKLSFQIILMILCPLIGWDSYIRNIWGLIQCNHLCISDKSSKLWHYIQTYSYLQRSTMLATVITLRPDSINTILANRKGWILS